MAFDVMEACNYFSQVDELWQIQLWKFAI